MINCEVKIFNDVVTKAADGFARFISSPLTGPVELPAGCLYEMDSRTVKRTQSSTPGENFSQVTYQLEVYDTTKSGARGHFSNIDNYLIQRNFTRISMQYVPNNSNPDVHRYVGRYEAIVDTDYNIYRA